MGRHSTYTPELGKRICEALSGHKSGLRSLCDDNPDFPEPATIIQWRSRFPDFAEGYAQAREAQLVMMAEDIVDLSDDDTLDPQDKRLRVDTRKWLLSKLVHTVYGDKLDVTSGGEAISTPPHMIDARVQSIIMQARARKHGTEPLPQLDDNALKLLD